MERWFEALQRRLEQATPRQLRLPGMELREASVLLPLYFSLGQPHILFTRRPETLRSHAGQISFPGGSRDPDDATPLHAALRETHEELGVPPEQVRVLGTLDEIPTVTGFRIQPFVGVVAESSRFAPSPEEVSELLVVPWRHLTDPANVRTERKVFWGKELDTYFFQWRDHVIWGATAHILQNLLHLAKDVPAWQPDSRT